MDSINKNQAEENHKDLSGGEAGEKLKELVKKAKNCFFCTELGKNGPLTTRPMSVQHIEDDGTCWFLSATDSKKNAQLAKDNRVQLLFQGSTYSDFVTITGEAIVSRDKVRIRELWEPILKTWFTEGVDDPRISVIEVRPSEGYYWDTKHGQVVAFVKQVAGALTGKTLDDSIEGKLSI